MNSQTDQTAAALTAACRDVQTSMAAKKPIATAHNAMVARLASLIPPRLYANNDPQDFEAVSEYLLDVARIVDDLILSVGRDVKSSATTNIDLTNFESPTRDALEGFAIYDISRAVASLKEDRNAA